MIAARLMRGAISVSTSSHLPANAPSMLMKPVRQARNEASADRVGDARKYDRDRPRRLLKRSGRRSRSCKDHIRLQVNQLFREHPQSVNVAAGPTNLHPHVAATVQPNSASPCMKPERKAFITGSLS